MCTPAIYKYIIDFMDGMRGFSPKPVTASQLDRLEKHLFEKETVFTKAVSLSVLLSQSIINELSLACSSRLS